MSACRGNNTNEFPTTSWSGCKENISRQHHNFSGSPNQCELSISLWTADQPGDMQYRRCSIGAALDDVITVVLYYCSPQKVVWSSVWDVSFRRPAVELLVVTMHRRAQPCHTKSASLRPNRWVMAWNFTGVSGTRLPTSSLVVHLKKKNWRS